MSSGLIYAAIVGVWAVVLVPVWLRRHDEAVESRSVDRFQGAMRTLSRRRGSGSGGVERREVLMPRRYATRAVPDGAAAEVSATTVAAARRRRTGLLLTVLTVLVAVLGALSVVPWWSALVPLALLVGFGLQVRLAARRARSRDLAARRARAARARRDRRLLTAAAIPMPAARAAGARDALFDQAAAPEVARQPLAATVAAAPAAAPEPAEFYDAQAERVWDPVPVPLPTYVLAPKAARSVRVIDLTRPGAWTSGRLPDDVHDAGVEAAPGEDEQVAPPPNGVVVGEVLVERRAVGD